MQIRSTAQVGRKELESDVEVPVGDGLIRAGSTGIVKVQGSHVSERAGRGPGFQIEARDYNLAHLPARIGSGVAVEVAIAGVELTPGPGVFGRTQGVVKQIGQNLQVRRTSTRFTDLMHCQPVLYMMYWCER